jgi:spermidine synthase
VIPWRLVDGARTPDGRGELALYQRGEEFAIRVDGRVLMGSRQHASEEALAELAVDGREAARICVAGLGMGFTLAAVLARVGGKATVCVVELSAAVVRWNRGPLAHLAAHPLDDARCSVVEGDIFAHLAEGGARYDAILLDVDNGPEALSQPGNARIYETRGLRAMRDRLEPGGRLALWSAGPDEAFTRRLRAEGFSVAIHEVRSRGDSGGSRHQIWVATLGNLPPR